MLNALNTLNSTATQIAHFRGDPMTTTWHLPTDLVDDWKTTESPTFMHVTGKGWFFRSRHKTSVAHLDGHALRSHRYFGPFETEDACVFAYQEYHDAV